MSVEISGYQQTLLDEVAHAFRTMIDSEVHYVQVANAFQDTVVTLRDALEEVRLSGITDLRERDSEHRRIGLDLKRCQRILDGLQLDAERRSQQASDARI